MVHPGDYEIALYMIHIHPAKITSYLHETAESSA